MKARTILTILLPLSLAGLAAMVATQWVNQRLGAREAPADLVPVVAAATNVAVGTKLDATHVKVVQLPPDAVPEGGFASLEDAIGRVTRQPVYSGEILLMRRVVEHAGGSPLSAVIEEGKRAVTVRVNDVIGVAGFLLPGSRVDVIATDRKGESRTVLENIKVLAVDQSTEANKESAVVVRAVTLEVDPQEAEIIVKATQLGSVQLTLRNPMDIAQVIEPEPPPEPAAEAKPEPPPEPVPQVSLYAVDVVRGIEVTTTTVRN